VSPAEIRPLAAEAWLEALRLCGRAFIDYEYAHALFGDDPVARLGGVTAEFASDPWDPDALAVGAWAGSALVGLAVADRPGRCRVCLSPTQIEPPADDRVAQGAFRFELSRRRAHADLPPHAQLRHVAVESLVRGAGIGSALVEAAVDAFRGAGGGPLILECVTPLETFYAREGFRPVGPFDDPLAAPLIVMRRDV
jgi:GNAT superfamily N-acetyltransferase